MRATLRIALALVSLIAIVACAGGPPPTAAPSSTGSGPTSTIPPDAVDPTTPATTDRPAATTTTALPMDLASRLARGPRPVAVDDPVVELGLRVESRVADVDTRTFASTALAVLADGRSWAGAGVRFRLDPASPLRLVLAEPAEVDRLCAPLTTEGEASCQNGTTVAINARLWREAVPHWPLGLEAYRSYVVVHEVGHLFGLRHPRRACGAAGRPSAVMGPQTGTLAGCTASALPQPWELEVARRRPLQLAPDPDWDGPRATPPPGA